MKRRRRSAGRCRGFGLDFYPIHGVQGQGEWDFEQLGLGVSSLPVVGWNEMILRGLLT